MNASATPPLPALWAEMREAGVFAVPRLIEQSGARPTLVEAFIRRLLAIGWLRELNPDRAPRQPRFVHVTEGAGANVPFFTRSGVAIDADDGRVFRVRGRFEKVLVGVSDEVGTAANERLWRAMRILKVFDTTQLATTAEVSERTACTYAAQLSRARLITMVRARDPEHGEPARYACKSAGPRAPVIITANDGTRRVVAVHDVNSSRLIDIVTRQSSDTMAHRDAA